MKTPTREEEFMANIWGKYGVLAIVCLAVMTFAAFNVWSWVMALADGGYIKLNHVSER